MNEFGNSTVSRSGRIGSSSGTENAAVADRQFFQLQTSRRVRSWADALLIW